MIGHGCKIAIFSMSRDSGMIMGKLQDGGCHRVDLAVHDQVALVTHALADCSISSSFCLLQLVMII